MDINFLLFRVIGSDRIMVDEKGNARKVSGVATLDGPTTYYLSILQV
jgi:hypothetical protein